MQYAPLSRTEGRGRRRERPIIKPGPLNFRIPHFAFRISHLAFRIPHFRLWPNHSLQSAPFPIPPPPPPIPHPHPPSPAPVFVTLHRSSATPPPSGQQVLHDLSRKTPESPARQRLIIVRRSRYRLAARPRLPPRSRKPRPR